MKIIFMLIDYKNLPFNFILIECMVNKQYVIKTTLINYFIQI
ncbi:hypothetical protein CoNPh17_CDS0155 [Staphylococcus phage S-CoN_Ph17]|nr:hypothetical protein CoNPh17_CDS0155 [Staphylococcus phage S-CoN_Ph17]